MGQVARRTHTLELPYPPSANHSWRRVGQRVLLSRGARRYREQVESLLAGLDFEQLEGPLEVSVCIFPPDARKRDADNVLKGLLDALQHGGAYRDDSQIQDLRIKKGAVIPGGKAVVEIKSV